MKNAPPFFKTKKMSKRKQSSSNNTSNSNNNTQKQLLSSVEHENVLLRATLLERDKEILHLKVVSCFTCYETCFTTMQLMFFQLFYIFIYQKKPLSNSLYWMKI